MCKANLPKTCGSKTLTAEVVDLDDIAKAVAEFYGKLNFPGPYRIEDLEVYDQGMVNPFLRPYDMTVGGSCRVLDIGCGSGFISNLLAYRHKHVQFCALDFSDSINYAKEFAQKNRLSNIQYHKLDFFDFETDIKFDCIISNGVLHHIPQYQKAIDKIDSLLAIDGKLVVGLYNRFGKLLKKIIPIRYRSQLLYADQELVPFEVSFTDKQVIEMFPTMQIQSVYPSYNKKLVDVYNIFNYNNGGLTIYSFRKNKNA